jgi:hypothetical protein
VTAKWLPLVVTDDAPSRFGCGRVDDLVAATADAQPVAIDDRVDGASAVCEPRREPGLVLALTCFPVATVQVEKPQPLLLPACLLVASCSLLE